MEVLMGRKSTNRIGFTLRMNPQQLKAVEAAAYIIGATDTKMGAKHLLLSSAKAVIDNEKQRREEQAKKLEQQAKEQTDGQDEGVQADTADVVETEQLQTATSGAPEQEEV
jgi:hypothetical protein